MRKQLLSVAILALVSTSGWANTAPNATLNSKAVHAAAVKFLNDYTSFNFDALKANFTENGQWCAGSGSKDYVFNACYQGNSGISFLLSKAPSIYAAVPGHDFLTLRNVTVNDNSAVLQVEEWYSFATNPAVALHSDTFWALDYVVVNGQLKVSRFYFVHAPAVEDLPVVTGEGLAH